MASRITLIAALTLVGCIMAVSFFELTNARHPIPIAIGYAGLSLMIAFYPALVVAIVEPQRRNRDTRQSIVLD